VLVYWLPHDLSNWDFADSIFPAGFLGYGVLNHDAMVGLDGARPPH